MRFEVVVLPAAEVARANDLDRVRQGVAAAVGAIGDLKRGARVAQSYGEHPLTAFRRPHRARTAVAGAFGGMQPEPRRVPEPGPCNPVPGGLR